MPKRTGLVRARTVVLPVLAAAVAVATVGCQPKIDPDPDPTVGLTRRDARWTAPVPPSLRGELRALVHGDSVVVRAASGGVAVFARDGGRLRWELAPEPSDPPRKVRVGADSIVVFRHNTVDVRDLRTGELRLNLALVNAAGASWTTLFVETPCVPECGLRAIDLRTGRQLWKRADVRLWHGNVLVEPGEPDIEIGPGPDAPRPGPLRAPDAEVILARQFGDGKRHVVAVDAATGRELSSTEVSGDAQAAYGSRRTFLIWSLTADCRFAVTGHDLRTGARVWTVDVGARPLTAPKTCTRTWQPQIGAGSLAVVTPEGRIGLIGMDDGRPRWTADNTTEWIGMTDRAALVRGVDGRDALVAVDVNTGLPRPWRLTPPKDAKGAGKPVSGFVGTGDTVAYGTRYRSYRGDQPITWLCDLSTGRIQWYAVGGEPIGLDADWLVTASIGGIRLHPLHPTERQHG